jgi:2-iminobutanoate/2-iminopropanoate deaminase
MSLKRKVISTQAAPAAVGPYSQAIQIGDFIYTAGQIPLVAETGKIVEGDIQTQTRQVMKNLANILEAGNSSLSNIVKTTIYVTDLNDFAAINEVYGSFFDDAPPARSTVQVVALPLGARVEIEAVAIIS